ncbi:uncharacterized protein LOC143076921 [Mytilus galloprovincialis]|uniref:uncharacterized protein LOC143076921 n=1 Tax=Mytilus galloprovincialis TaxID=29158 RepID=UPI003F7B4CFD
MIILLILVFATVTGYDLKCPVKSEWRLRANVSCYLEDKYVCVFHLLKGKYEENCLGSDQSSIGSKLVFQPLFNLAKCNVERFQPIVFTTHGNSKCILRKSECSEEGQVVYSNESSSIDTVCRCDYTRGYAHVSKPQNRCFCIPSEEDCSCFKVECTQLSADYQCIPDDKKITDVNCEEIQPKMSYNRHNQTVRIIQNEIHRYSNVRLVSYIILILLAFYPIVAVITVIAIEYQDKKSKHLKSKDDEKQRFIQELFLKGECGKHHFARLIFIGKNGVGKTSLMRRLLWKNKKDVISTLSTDGIEVEKCNINITNGKWSPSDEIDDDLTRLIHQVYTEKNIIVKRAAGENIADKVQLGYNTDESIDVSDTDESSNVDENYYIDSLRVDSDNDSINSEESQTSIPSIHQFMPENIDYNETVDINLKREQPNNIKFQNEYDININNKANESNPVSNADINQLTSTIMKSYIQRSGKEPDDTMAFCWLWDFAGQKDFYATHQVFLSNCAVFLLVTDSLEFSTAEKPGIDFEDSTQYVNFWFDAIHCYWSTTKEDRLDPPIIVVCTNEDKLKGISEQKQRHELFEENLRKNLREQKKKNHLREIYFVSNTEDDDDVFEEIRHCISRQAMQMNDWGRVCPLKWILFQQVLGKLKESGVPISTTKQLLKIATHDDIGISNNEEFKLCLQYCHDNGTVIYFEEENLKDHVILDPKWLVDAFRCLVSDKIETKIKLSDHWQNLIETGELTDTLITALFKKEPHLKFLENKIHLLEVMIRFDIIVSLKNSSALYMPCMMTPCTFEEVRKHFIDESQFFYRTSWLCLDFEFLPPAFFNHILAWYIRQYSVSTITEKGTRNERKTLYRQIGVFNLDSSGCEQLVVCEGPNVIALQVWNSRISDQAYVDFRTKLCQFVDTLLDRYKLKLTFTLSFKCKDGDFTINRQTMNILVTTDYRCFEHKTNHISEDLVKPWFVDREIR